MKIYKSAKISSKNFLQHNHFYTDGFKVADKGRSGNLVGIAAISKMVEEKDKDGNPVKTEKADPHGIQVRKK